MQWNDYHQYFCTFEVGFKETTAFNVYVETGSDVSKGIETKHERDKPPAGDRNKPQVTPLSIECFRSTIIDYRSTSDQCHSTGNSFLTGGGKVHGSAL